MKIAAIIGARPQFIKTAVTKATAHSDILARLALQPQGYLLATVHRAENTDDNKRLTNILLAFAALNEPVVFPAHPRTRKYLQEAGYQPPENVKLWGNKRKGH